MMYAIEKGNVPTYTGTCDDLIYLVTSVERVLDLQLPAVFTDRNAVLQVAKFTTDPADLDTMIDWELMNATYWNNTDDEPDRRERRMAECLIYDRLPWSAILGVAAKTDACADRARAAIAAAGAATTVAVRPAWYF